MIIQMTDGTRVVQVDESHKAEFEARGFTQEGAPTELQPGQLVGHGIRVHNEEEAPLPEGHVPQMVQATDGHQVIWVDAAHTARLATFIKRGFLPVPPMPEVEMGDDESHDQYAVRRNEAHIAYNAQVAEIKEQARAKNGTS